MVAALAGAVGKALGGFGLSTGMDLLGGVGRATAMAANRLLPNQPLGVENYALLYQMGLMSKDLYKAHILEMGYVVSGDNASQMKLLLEAPDGKLAINRYPIGSDAYYMDKHLAISKGLISPEEILVMVNRGLMTEQAALFLLKLMFGGEDKLARKYYTLKDQIPGPSDLIAFAVRDCFDPNIVSTFQYNKELPSAILPWMEKQGLAGDVGLPMPAGSTTSTGPDARTRAQWFDMYWWSHWQLPSVGQGFELLQRLYPDSMYGPSPYATQDTYFSRENLELLQKANDFPPFWRERLQAIAYKPLGRIDIKRMYAAGILHEDANTHEVFHAYKQQGYNDVDSKRLTDYTVKKARPNISDLTMVQIKRLYKQGSISDERAIQSLQALDFTNREASYQVQNWKLEISADTVDYKLKYVRSAFLNADIDEHEVISYFLGMRLEQAAQDRYLARWKMQLQVTYKHITVEKAINLRKKGYITYDQLLNKLNNLRYSITEQHILLQETEDEIAIAQAKREASLAKSQAKEVEKVTTKAIKVADAKAKATLKQQEALAKEHAKLLAKDQAAFTEKNIIAFWKKGLLDESQIRNILQVKAWLPDTIDLWIETYNPNTPKDATNVASQTPQGNSGPVARVIR